MITKIREAPCLDWPLAKVIRTLPDTTGEACTVEVQVENEIYRCLVEHFVPLKLLYEEHQDAIQIEGNNDPCMWTEPDGGDAGGITATTRGINPDNDAADEEDNGFHFMQQGDLSSALYLE